MGCKESNHTNKLREKIAVIRSNLLLASSANIADVKFFHKTIAVIGPILNKLLQVSCQLIPIMCIK